MGCLSEERAALVGVVGIDAAVGCRQFAQFDGGYLRVCIGIVGFDAKPVEVPRSFV